MSDNPRKKILAADDEEWNVELLKVFCHSKGYDFVEAFDGIQAVEKAFLSLPDIILMDVMMPKMNGFQAIEMLKNDERTKRIPIIILTSLSSYDDRLKGISAGADDYIIKPFDSNELALKITNHLKIKEYQDLIVSYNISLQDEVNKKTMELQNSLTTLDELFSKVKQGYIETIYRLALAAEYKDLDTGEHIKRIGQYSKIIAKELGMSQEFQDLIYYASPLHDIGKVGIPDSLLLKHGQLTPPEWEMMKTHTTIGSKILSGSLSPYLKMAEDIALCHHEKWDGSGYPNAVKCENIPLSARIVSLADQYDALRSTRVYKHSLTHAEVFEILTKGDSISNPGHFDPQILEIFKKHHTLLEEAYKSLTSSNKQKEAH